MARSGGSKGAGAYCPYIRFSKLTHSVMCNLYGTTDRQTLRTMTLVRVPDDLPDWPAVVGPLSQGVYVRQRGDAVVGQWGMIPMRISRTFWLACRRNGLAWFTSCYRIVGSHRAECRYLRLRSANGWPACPSGAAQRFKCTAIANAYPSRTGTADGTQLLAQRLQLGDSLLYQAHLIV